MRRRRGGRGATALVKGRDGGSGGTAWIGGRGNAARSWVRTRPLRIDLSATGGDGLPGAIGATVRVRGAGRVVGDGQGLHQHGARASRVIGWTARPF